MNSKFTNRAREAIENSLNIALTNMNTLVEPEHLLRSILDNPSILNKILPTEEISKLKMNLNNAISGFGKTSSAQQPQMSGSFMMVLNEASKKSIDFVSIPCLISALLSQPRICNLLLKPDEVKKAINENLKNNKYESQNSDDPEDKMTKFAVEVVELARHNKLDPVIGRENEIRQIIEILSKKTKSNAIMVGKPGVGKTAIINGLAQLIAKDECKTLEGFKIYNVDVAAMVSGASHRGDFEERLKGLVKEAEQNKKTILFIDEIHTVLGAGKAEGSMDAANILKPGLADGSLKVIGATTYDEYRKYVTKDPAFERRFVRVDVKEPTPEDTVTILRGLKERFEIHHGVKIADKALVFASTMSKRYIPNRRLPDLAIELVDIACASALINLNSEPTEIQHLKNKIWSLELEKTSIEIDLKRDPSVIESLHNVEKKLEESKKELKEIEDNFNKEMSHVSEARNIRKKLDEARNRCEQAKRDGDRYQVYDITTNIIPIYEKQLSEIEGIEIVIKPQNIAEAISRLTGIPISKLTIKENEKLLSLQDKLKNKIFGQDEAVEAVSNSILAAKVGLSNENKPLASFLFLGPSGVGKTELAKAICEELNDTIDNMVVLDMSDYVSEISINKLIGAPAGYVGCEEGGALTEPIKEMPYNVVLLDEINLAHQSCINVLYQLLDEGRVTDGRGVRVSFKNTVVVMTSNLGQEYISSNFVDKAKIEELLLARFGHALVNRIDNVVIFNHLSRDSLKNIFIKDLKELNQKLLEKNLKFNVSNAVLDYAVDSSLNSSYGARIMKRFIKDNFTNPLSKIILSKKSEDLAEVTCYLNAEEEIGLVQGNFTFVVK